MQGQTVLSLCLTLEGTLFSFLFLIESFINFEGGNPCESKYFPFMYVTQRVLLAGRRETEKLNFSWILAIPGVYIII